MNVREALFNDMSGCSNRNCVISPSEIGTNGRCNCIKNMDKAQLSVLESRIKQIADCEIIETEEEK